MKDATRQLFWSNYSNVFMCFQAKCGLTNWRKRMKTKIKTFHNQSLGAKVDNFTDVQGEIFNGMTIVRFSYYKQTFRNGHKVSRHYVRPAPVRAPVLRLPG